MNETAGKACTAHTVVIAVAPCRTMKALNAANSPSVKAAMLPPLQNEKWVAVTLFAVGGVQCNLFVQVTSRYINICVRNEQCTLERALTTSNGRTVTLGGKLKQS